ncbi:ABC transporter ATP-binding protein [Actinokineospora inagensis]|uniref:ABC transporter ATP-binding protein n=1 Tax=Actinokineospora inagensis TaxID=103730 RepID=UPI000425CC6D|nr:ABC transporter ATP-binding protein [Actinokineospora inagensis]
MIEAEGLTKRYGAKTAVDGLSFVVRPGIVTGFLGPNGAGKSTTMRLILGLDAPTAGSVTVNGSRYARLRAPLREVGALLEARSVHTGRSARNHLRALAATTGVPTKRVDDLLEMVGLADVAHKWVRGFSLGMHQRLGVAAALLGDPHTLVLDEPVNGLDPEGIRWIRGLLRSLAAEGRTVFLSSHLMSEMAQTAEQVIIVGKGRLIADLPVADVINRASGSTVEVRTPQADELRGLLADRRIAVTPIAADRLAVNGVSSSDIGLIALENRIHLVELTPVLASLEEAFMDLTRDAVEFGGATHPALEGTPR